MNVSDPIVFDQYTQKLFKDALEKHAAMFEDNQVKAMLGLGDTLENMKQFPEEKRADIDADTGPCSAIHPPPAMADSRKGITDSRAPSDVSVDAAIPAMIRGMGGWGGGTWCFDWLPEDQDSDVCCTKARIPDPCQPGVFVDEVELCNKNGACNPATMGSVPNGVVISQRASEYGSHDKIFETPGAGRTPLATPLTTLVIQTELTEEDMRSCQPSSMKRVTKCNTLLDAFVRKPSCVAGTVFD